jgi:hypothetical protein
MLANQAERQSARGPRYLPWRKRSDASAQAVGETSSVRDVSPQDESSVCCHVAYIYFAEFSLNFRSSHGHERDPWKRTPNVLGILCS